MNIGLMWETLKRLSSSSSYLIAYSGGMDSHVLLHALVTLRQRYTQICLRALHVHHGLHPSADQWLLHCQRICRVYRVPFLFEKMTPPLNNVESQAREARRLIFSHHLQKHECLLTAHTEDDQAETLLLQLLRGAGPRGLGGMPFKKALGLSTHLRPLLNICRDDIKSYALTHRLEWIEDSSNTDTRFNRNYLRHRLMPVLKKRWPAVTSILSRSAMHCASAHELLWEEAQRDVRLLQALQTNALCISRLLTLHTVRRRNALRYWLEQRVDALPNTQQLIQIERNLLKAGKDKNPIFHLGKAQLRRYRDYLYCLENAAAYFAFDSRVEIVWDCQTPLDLPGSLGQLQPMDFSDFKQLTIRFRRGGECIKPRHSVHTYSLKKLFQQWGVPPWERGRIPLIFDEKERLIMVWGYCQAAAREN